MSTSHDDLQRSLGRVEGNLSQMEARMDRFEKLVSEGFKEIADAVAEVKSEVEKLKDKETERRGAWKVIVAVSAFVSGLVAAATKYLVSG